MAKTYDPLKEITKKFGDGSCFILGQQSDNSISVIPSGSLSLDEALGVGGYPKGKIIEIYGPESSGKTTLCIHAIREIQRLGGKAAFVDTEHGIDGDWLATCGVNVSELYISQPDSGETALEIVEAFIKSGEVDLVVVDSVSALAPRAEIEGNFGDSHMALQARLMSQGMRKLVGPASEYKTTVIFTNQLRQKIGVFFGNPETTTGGMALKFYASVRLDVRKKEPIKDKGQDVVGNKVSVTVRKNKVSAPAKIANLTIRYDEGISMIDELLDRELSVIEKGGAGWYTINGDEKIQGMENLVNRLKADKELLKKVENEVRQQLRLPIILSEE